MSKMNGSLVPIEVTPGLWQIPLPIPIRSLGRVFSYFVEDKGHNLLIDAGWPSEASLKALESSLSEIGTTPKDIEKILVSHLHPDHFGLAEPIMELNPKTRLSMHRADAAHIIENHEGYNNLIKELNQWLELNGTPEQELNAITEASREMLHFFRPPVPTDLVSGGELINVGKKWKFEIISTPGHTEGTICLMDRGGSKIFFSGDHILPTITPNISLGPFYKGNPLGDYLSSLELLSPLDVAMVLPSHEHIFSDLHGRVSEIRKHHFERIEGILRVFEEFQRNDEGKALSGYFIASKLHWYSGSWESLGAWERRAAIMETLAHLQYLKIEGKVAEIQSLVKGKPKSEYALIFGVC